MLRNIESVLHNIRLERQRQDEKWGIQEHCDLCWLGILMEEAGELSQEIVFNNPLWRPETAEFLNLYALAKETVRIGKLWKMEIERVGYAGNRGVAGKYQAKIQRSEKIGTELLQVAGVSVAWLEHIVSSDYHVPSWMTSEPRPTPWWQNPDFD